jgi:hypothetical protein
VAYRAAKAENKAMKMGISGMKIMASAAERKWRHQASAK